MKRREIAQILTEFVVLNANGIQAQRAVGIAAIAWSQSFILVDVARLGTHLKRAENVRVANTSGVSHLVFHAAVGLCTRIGMILLNSRFRISRRKCVYGFGSKLFVACGKRH